MKYRFHKSPHPYLCFASCLRTIMEGYSSIESDEFQIGDELGITTPNSRDADFFNHRQSSIGEDWGIDTDTNRINALLKSYRSDLTCQYHSSFLFEDYSFDDFVKASLANNNMVIFGFDYNTLFKMLAKDIVGHAVIGFGSIDKQSSLGVNIYDPGPLLSGQKQVDSFDMYVACKRKGGGIWTFSKTS